MDARRNGRAACAGAASGHPGRRFQCQRNSHKWAHRQLRHAAASSSETASFSFSPALARLQISLRAPFHELAAIRIETGHATEVHLVVRADELWRAAPRALMVDEHDDPGCPSIVRDGRLREVRVESANGAPALVVIDEASRGAGEEDAPDGGAPIYWSLELTRASACRLETGGAGAMACDEPVVLRALRTPGQGDADPRAQVRFTTDHHLDASGHIKTSQAYDDARMWE